MRAIAILFFLSVPAFCELSPKAADVREVLVRAKAEIREARPKNSTSDIQIMMGLFESADDTDGMEIRHPTMGELKNLLGVAWRDAVDNLEDVAPGDLDKVILIEAMWYIAPEDYLSALDIILDHFGQHPYRTDILGFALMPLSGDNYMILSYNYKDPRVKTIIEKARPLMRDQPDYLAYFDEVFSGKDYAHREDYRASFPQEFRWLRKLPVAAPRGADANPGAMTDHERDKMSRAVQHLQEVNGLILSVAIVAVLGLTSLLIYFKRTH